MMAPRWSRVLPSLRGRGGRAQPVRCEEAMPAPTPEEAQAPKPDNSAKSFENFAGEWQNASSQDNWDGFRIEAANQVTKQMQAVHSLFLGTQMRPEGYLY